MSALADQQLARGAALEQKMRQEASEREEKVLHRLDEALDALDAGLTAQAIEQLAQAVLAGSGYEGKLLRPNVYQRVRQVIAKARPGA